MAKYNADACSFKKSPDFCTQEGRTFLKFQLTLCASCYNICITVGKEVVVP